MNATKLAELAFGRGSDPGKLKSSSGFEAGKVLAWSGQAQSHKPLDRGICSLTDSEHSMANAGSRSRPALRWCLEVCFLGAVSQLAAADQQRPPPIPTLSDIAAPLNWEIPTFGGKQVWTDEFVHLEWRIQRNVLTGHHRLLDDQNVRRAWGDFDQCRAVFAALKQELNLPALQPRVVIVLHGLIRSRESMSGLCRYLTEHSDFSVLNVSYASSREELADHAAALARIVDRLEGVDEVNFVGHSLGNLVIRHYLGDRVDAGGRRAGRVVMIGPPNHGAELARRFKDNPLFQIVFGDTGRQLAEQWSRIAPRLAIPRGEFGIIAGGTADNAGFSPLISGDDDFVVAVSETQLPGAADFIVVPVLHATIMNNPQVQEQTLRFLRHGYFVSAETRQPLPAALPMPDP
jgi:pimeloyl-ACP methyl ester carboxylesterase